MDLPSQPEEEVQLGTLDQSEQRESSPQSANAAGLSEGAGKLSRLLWSLFRASLSRGDQFCYPSQAYMADKIGRSVRMVKRYLQELEQAGVIRRRRTRHGNRYYLMEQESKPTFIGDKMSPAIDESIKRIIQQQQPARAAAPNPPPSPPLQKPLAAAADLFLPLEIQDACNALRGLDMPDGLASLYAKRDHRLAIAVATYSAERFRDPAQTKVRNKIGFLRGALETPIDFGFSPTPSGAWIPPATTRQAIAEQRKQSEAQRETARKAGAEQRARDIVADRRGAERWRALSTAEKERLRQKVYEQAPGLRAQSPDGFLVVAAALKHIDREQEASHGNAH